MSTLSNRPFDLQQLQVYPLKERESLTAVDEVMVDPASEPPPCSEQNQRGIQRCARKIRAAREKGAGVTLMYGAHLVKNGGNRIVNRLLEKGWVTHLATHGAGVIHDWEFAFLGRSTENVRANVAAGRFGAWEETGRTVNLAVLAGGLRGEGFGRALGRCVREDGFELPSRQSLIESIRKSPDAPFSAAQAELLRVMNEHRLEEGRVTIEHPWKRSSILAQAYEKDVPLTVHPGIGYDIISNHPLFNGAALGRAAEMDFRVFCSSVERLDGGVVLSVGSAVMAPQVFEKSVSCVNNLRLQAHRSILGNHSIFVVDLQEGGNRDWTQGEPPVGDPAYYLRFCKSFSRMGGEMHYLRCDNIAFLHNLLKELEAL